MADETQPAQRLAWPPALKIHADGSQSFASVDQDSDAEVRQAVLVVAGIRVGTLPIARALGIPSPLGRSDPDEAAALIQAALSSQEQRPRSISVAVVDTPDQPRSIRLKVTP